MTSTSVTVTEARVDASPRALLRVSGMAKAFGPTQALRDSSFELLEGEVHAIVGENGSGKSTLMKILSGVHAPDAGTIELADREIAPLRSPRVAQASGIATVFQEVLVAPARSVLQNVWLGIDSPLKAHLSSREKRARARALLEELLGQSLPLDTAVEELPLSDRQACCIVRALVREPRILILDEATSALDIAARDRLFDMMARMTKDGVGIIFITHRMDEISRVGDRITVMRNGVTVGGFVRGQWTPRELVHLMTGSDEIREHARQAVTAIERRGDVLLSARGLRLTADGAAFDVDVHAGELIGVAGLEGQGQDEFLEALCGSMLSAGTVVRHLDGADIELDSRAAAAKRGVVYVPRERGQSMFRWMTIRENFGMPTLARDSRYGWLRPEATRNRLGKYIAELKIVLGRTEDAITTLSGGNQQKVVVARWLAAAPQVLVLNDPTRGIDIGAKRDLYELLTHLAVQGVGVVMLSTEIDEHIELMDRVLVFYSHELFAEIPREKLSRQALVSAFFGQEEEADRAATTMAPTRDDDS
jgi:ABC-type sugar transport system ATPase subunit